MFAIKVDALKQLTQTTWYNKPVSLKQLVLYKQGTKQYVRQLTSQEMCYA